MGGAMSAALRRSGADAVAPPSRPPRRPGARDAWRAFRARRRGVVVGADVALGRGVRFDLADGAALTLHDGVQLGDGCRFHLAAGAVAAIGAGSVLGERCALTVHSRAQIGAGCVLGDEVVLLDVAPVAADPERPVRQQGTTATPIAVGDGARIGPSAVLLGGATIAAGTMVGAHTTVPAAA
jgi:carbonic anhydrase/acetyltransferase-like protein (isoleucine patch superfamily)